MSGAMFTGRDFITEERAIIPSGSSQKPDCAFTRNWRRSARNRLIYRTSWFSSTDSKTPTGVALTDIATDAFQSQMEVAGPGPWLFPVRKAQPGMRRTSRRPGANFVEGWYTYPTSGWWRCGRMVTQLLGQTDAKVFQKYSQMKLQMKREALTKLNRHANGQECV
jgi:hypothetical protein